MGVGRAPDRNRSRGPAKEGLEGRFESSIEPWVFWEAKEVPAPTRLERELLLSFRMNMKTSRRKRGAPVDSGLARFSMWATKWAGSSWAFAVACGVVVVWVLTGPIFHYSDTWQLVINTGTTIVTFLMVFLIQNTQNRDTLAIQLKLSELVLAMKGAENKFAAIEDLTDEELEELHKDCRARAEMTLQQLEGRRRPGATAGKSRAAAQRAKSHARASSQ